MAFPTTSAQQAETNRKILEEIQTKKQLLAGGIINLGLSPPNQVSSLGTCRSENVFTWSSIVDARTPVAGTADDSESRLPGGRGHCHQCHIHRPLCI